MARPKSDTKRNDIMTAAIRVIAEQGIGASTAMIGKVAGVSNGALFTYFETKAVLLNQLYLELKARMATMTTADVPVESGSVGGSPREQLRLVWYAMLGWARERPLERLALAQVSVSKDVTDETRALAAKPYAEVEALLDRCRAKGAMRDASPAFLAKMVLAMVDATIDSIAVEPEAADKHAEIGFDALWRAIH
ncbi:TetR/AcrR family transcriptional regulator [uncultured Novosphingobium sp.]|uniref:TetR/AcrR family transcriptional regulator n=1 Tax=uncultured Novosphingobium sp. TaxID=292277 RepID=UPI00258FBEED|nr:TetR/AcrR family transcriptional regulator [uncultured Novosphingobium sp.]